MGQTIPIGDRPGKGDDYQGVSNKKRSRDLTGLDPWLKELSPPKVSFMGTIKASGA